MHCARCSALPLLALFLCVGASIPGCTLRANGNASGSATVEAGLDGGGSEEGGFAGGGGEGGESGLGGTAGSEDAGGEGDTAGEGGTTTHCKPGETQCEDASVRTCSELGQWDAPVLCPSGSCENGFCSLCPTGAVDCDGDFSNGCEGTAGHCFSYAPSNVDPSSYTSWLSAPKVVLSCNATLDTTPLTLTQSGTVILCGETLPYELRTQADGPNVVVVWLKGLTIAAGATIRLVGDKPAVFFVDGAVDVSGTVDAGSSAGAPGAGASVSACAAEDGAPDYGGGGGGFQFAGSGGARRDVGASASCPTTQHAGPAVAATLSPLRAGCAGGKGANGHLKQDSNKYVTPGGAGGFGGGAVQISASGPVTITGAITAGGAGGEPGATPAAQDTEQLMSSCGGGGGSGGAILLEGVGVVTQERVFANGGGGGGGGPGQRDSYSGACGKIGTAGGNGDASTTPAAPGQRGEGILDGDCAEGGETPNKWPGNGANGGTVGSPTLEAVCGEHWQGGGGGGGGGGWIIVHSH